MNERPFVKKKHFDIARTMEEKLMDLPADSGILFVGVSVSPTVKADDPIYRIWVGCDRSMSEDTIRQAVFMTLHEEISRGADVKQVDVHRGIIRVDKAE